MMLDEVGSYDVRYEVCAPYPTAAYMCSVRKLDLFECSCLSVDSAGRNSLPRTLLRYTAGALPRPPAPACPSHRNEPVGAWLRRRTVCGNPLWGLPHTGQWPAHYSRSHAFCGRSQPIDSPVARHVTVLMCSGQFIILV